MKYKKPRREFIKYGIKTGIVFPLLFTSFNSCNSRKEEQKENPKSKAKNKPLKILILGGTSFLGPHQISYSMKRGHSISIFTRGKTKSTIHKELYDNVEQLIGDRKKNHQLKQSVWLVYYRVSTKIPSLSWSEAVDEALCFGWIDSTKKTIDEERYMQYFSRRKPNSTWSKVNKDKVANLLQNNLITKAGFDSIETAKQNGTWTLMDDVEKLIIPEDLKVALNKTKGSMEFFQSQTKSTKKGMLYWVVIAKRMETRNEENCRNSTIGCERITTKSI